MVIMRLEDLKLVICEKTNPFTFLNKLIVSFFNFRLMKTISKMFKSKNFLHSSFSTVNASGKHENFVDELKDHVGTKNSSELNFLF